MERKAFFRPAAFALAGAGLLAAGCREHEHHDRDRAYRDQAPSAAQAAPSASADVSVGAETVVNEPPPAPMADPQPASPGPDYVWIGGSWVWNNRWVWQAGSWDRRPRPGAVYVPHQYVERGGRHVFVRGGWR